METTNGKDLFSSIREAVPNPAKGFNMAYIDAAKSQDMRNTACDQRIIKAAHTLYKAMEGKPFIIEDYLYVVKKSEKLPNAIEFLSGDGTVAFIINKLDHISEIANDGRNITDTDTAMFIGFALGMTEYVAKAADPSGILRKESNARP